MNELIFIGEFKNLLPYTAGPGADAAAAVFFEKLEASVLKQQGHSQVCSAIVHSHHKQNNSNKSS